MKTATTETRSGRRFDPRFVVGAALWLAVAAGYLVMAAFASTHNYFPADLRIEHWLQAQDRPTVGGILHVPNVLGDGAPPVLILGLFIVLALAMRRFAEAVMLIAVGAPRVVQLATKALVERPRPSPDLVHVTENASGWSFPSGHVIGIVAIFGLLIYLAPRLIPNRPLSLSVQAFSLFLVLAVGPARVYVGAHWPSDVLGSYVLGALFLAAAIWAYRTFLPRWISLAQRRVAALVRPQAL